LGIQIPENKGLDRGVKYSKKSRTASFEKNKKKNKKITRKTKNHKKNKKSQK